MRMKNFSCNSIEDRFLENKLYLVKDYLAVEVYNLCELENLISFSGHSKSDESLCSHDSGAKTASRLLCTEII